jgi:hypothetical protein
VGVIAMSTEPEALAGSPAGTMRAGGGIVAYRVLSPLCSSSGANEGQQRMHIAGADGGVGAVGKTFSRLCRKPASLQGEVFCFRLSAGTIAGSRSGPR